MTERGLGGVLCALWCVVYWSWNRRILCRGLVRDEVQEKRERYKSIIGHGDTDEGIDVYDVNRVRTGVVTLCGCDGWI